MQNLNCKCNNACFFTTKPTVENDKVVKYDIYKCNYNSAEQGKKKKKCDFYLKNKVSEAPIEQEDVKVISNKKITAKKTTNEELEYYIKMYELAPCKDSKSTMDYVANINYLLSKNGQTHFDPETESIDSLKKRYSFKIEKELFKFSPIKFVEVPESLKVSKIHKKKRIKKESVGNLIADDSGEESEEETDSENEEETGFDVDEVDSDQESEEFEDDGAFSD